MVQLTKRIALWEAHRRICHYCNNPLESLAGVDVDHIIPESLLDKPDQLLEVLKRLEKPDLDLNSRANWLPIHHQCNLKKGSALLPDAALHTFLDIAKRAEPTVLKEEEKIKKQSLNRKALAPVIHLIEIGELSKEEAKTFIDNAIAPNRAKSDPLVLSFSVNVVDLIDAGELPAEAPVAPTLYDWLENQLEESLRTTGAILARIEDQRDGECVSVRYAFWLLNPDTIPEPLPLRWDLLEVAPFSQLFPQNNPEDIFAKAIIAKSNELVFDKESRDPLAYVRCPICGSSELKRASQLTPREEIFYISCPCGWGEKF